MWYALFGILGVTPGANYGEGELSAKRRLLATIRDRDRVEEQRREQYSKLVKWLQPPDPWTSHESARKLHEEHTGGWLLQTNEYRTWKSGQSRHLWLYGGAGCGKTVLCSTVVQDMKVYCEGQSSIGHAIFYFSFSDERKCTYDSLLISLVAQLGYKEPGCSMLQQMHDRRRSPGKEELEKMLHVIAASYERVVCHLDALDECPEEAGARKITLDSIERLLKQAPNIHFNVTSRDEPDIRRFMVRLGVESGHLTAEVVDHDIQQYVSREIIRNERLARLNAATQKLVEDTLTQEANGMFRWVFCQIEELQRSKSTKTSAIRAALLALPSTLDEAYDRMLQRISTNDRPKALTLLRWLTYAQRPLSLEELAGASIIFPHEDTPDLDIVEIEDRGGSDDALSILAGLVVAVSTRHKHTTIRLAHFSVKEYLESSRITKGEFASCQSRPDQDHKWLTQSCLVYLRHYSNSADKSSSVRDLDAFPLLAYAASIWYRHALLQSPHEYVREREFLTSDSCQSDWLGVHKPDESWIEPFHDANTYYERGSPVLYAIFAGLKDITEVLLAAGADVNAQGGTHGNALQAASFKSYELIVQMLLAAGADVNAQRGMYRNALEAASFGGHQAVVQMLLAAGADVNAQRRRYNGALRYAKWPHRIIIDP